MERNYTCPAMPTYEYRCRDCGHTFDIVQKMSDDPLVICPECGGDLRKVFAPPTITFRGSGFYATDHGKKTKSGSDAAKPSESSGAKKDSGSASGSASERSSGDSSSDSSGSSGPSNSESSTSETPTKKKENGS